nr:hypothetical protein [uncultured Desulfobacter sp.]
MKIKNFLLTLTIIISSLTSAAHAASISVSPAQSYTVSPGDTTTFEVRFTADEDGDLFTGATLSLGYDAAELSFVSYGTPLGWEEFFGSASDESLSDGSYIANFNQNYPWTGSPVTVEAGQSIIIGTFTFEVTSGLLADGLSDLWLVDDVMVGEFTYSSIISYNDIYGEYASSLVTAQGADLSAVPLPSALWLTGAGLLGLSLIRRRAC